MSQQQSRQCGKEAATTTRRGWWKNCSQLAGFSVVNGDDRVIRLIAKTSEYCMKERNQGNKKFSYFYFDAVRNLMFSKEPFTYDHRHSPSGHIV